MHFTSRTTLEKALKHSGAKEVLAEFNLPCLSCPMMALEMGKLTLGEICQMYGIDFQSLLEKLNSIST